MPENRGVPVLYCSPWRTPARLSPGREQVANIVCMWFFFPFNTILSLWVTLSPHFLSFFLRRSLSVRSGLVFLPAWGGPAALSLPFILLTTCHSSLSAGWVLTAGLGAQEFWKVGEGIAVLDFPTLSACGRTFSSSFFIEKYAARLEKGLASASICLSSSTEEWLSSWMDQLASHWRKVNEFPACADVPFVSLPWHTEGIFNCALAVLQGQVDLMAFQSASICPEQLWIHVACCWVWIKGVEERLKLSQVFFYSLCVPVSLSLPCLSPCVAFFIFISRCGGLFCILKAQVVLCHVC